MFQCVNLSAVYVSQVTMYQAYIINIPLFTFSNITSRESDNATIFDFPFASGGNSGTGVTGNGA